MAKLAWMKFFPGDWMQDTPVLSLEAQGAWMRLLCAMWNAPDRGRISWPMTQVANFLGIEPGHASNLVDELIESGVADGEVTEDPIGPKKVTLRSRRILREENKHRQALERDRRYKRRKSDAKTTKRLQTSDVRHKNKRGEESQPSPEGRRSAQTLSDKIFENHPTRTAPTEAVLMEWSREADRIYKIDKHGWEEILSLIEWSQVDPFWKTNILSMSKFRKQWNQLTAHRSRGGEHEPKGSKGLESLKGWAGRLPKP